MLSYYNAGGSTGLYEMPYFKGNIPFVITVADSLKENYVSCDLGNLKVNNSFLNYVTVEI